MKNNKKHPLTFFREEGEKRKAMFQKGGYNIPKNELPKKFNGGPGSGMGRMAADDAAFDAMMNPPNKPASSTLSPETARLLAAKASEAQNTFMNTNNTNSQNVDLANAMSARMKATGPIMSKPPGVREGFTQEKRHKEMLNEQAIKYGTKPTKIISAEQAAKQGIYHKKGGAVKRKKK